MKTLFIPAKLKLEINKSKILEISRKIPKYVAIVYSIQYEEIALEIKEILEKSHKITKFTQILGCSKPDFPKDTRVVLLIGDGRFHAISLAYETKLPIYILNQDKLERISNKDTEILEKNQRVSYLRFLNADKVGILISTKPGQQNMKKALDLKKKLKKKKSYLFISNDINTSEFENFGLESWVNTACPRLDMDSNTIVNIDRIK